METASIKPIHDLYPFAQNGICAMIATMGSGKTYNYLKMMAKQEALDDDPFYELIVICSTSARFDKTVETFKKTIRKSKLICVKDSQLLAWLNAYMRRMLKYNAFMKYIQSDLRQTNDVIDKAIAKHRLTKKAKLIEYLAKKIGSVQLENVSPSMPTDFGRFCVASVGEEQGERNEPVIEETSTFQHECDHMCSND